MSDSGIDDQRESSEKNERSTAVDASDAADAKVDGTSDSPAEIGIRPELDALIDDVQELVVAASSAELGKWIQSQKSVLDTFCARVDRLAHIIQYASRAANASATLSEIARHADELSAWINAQSETEVFVPHSADAQWLIQFEELLKTLPTEVVLKMDSEDWQAEESDGAPVKIWKLFYRQRDALRRFWWRLTAFTRRGASDAASEEPPAFTRTFSIHNFLRYYAFLPLAELHRRAWMRHMDLLRTQIHQMRVISNDLYTQILQGDLFKDSSTVIDMDLPATKALLEESREQITSMRSALDESQQTLSERAVEINADVAGGMIHVWKIAGTLLRRDARFGKRAIERKHNTWRRVSEKYRAEWRTHMLAEADDWRKHLLFIRLEFDSAAAFYSGAAKLEQQKNAASVSDAFGGAVNMLKEAEESIAHLSTTTSPQRFETNLQQVSDRILARCADEILPQLIDAVLSIKYDAVVGAMSTTFLDLSNRLPAQQRFFIERDAEGNPPHSDSGSIPLRTIVNDGFMRDLQEGLRTMRDSIVTERKEIMRAISDVDDMIYYASSAALKLLQEPDEVEVSRVEFDEEVESTSKPKESKHDKARRIVAEGIQRAQNSINLLSERMHTLEEEVSVGIRETANSFVVGLRTLHSTDKLTDLKLQATRTKMRAGVQDVRYRIRVYLRYFRPRVRNSFSRLRTAFGTAYDSVRARLGFSRKMTHQHQNLQRMVLDAEKRVKELPFVYQRLFAQESLTDDRFLIGRDHELETLDEVFRSWRKGQYQAAAIVGESGSGKSSVLNFAEKRVFKSACVFRVASDVFNVAGSSLASKLGHVIGENTIDDLPALREHIVGIEKPVVFIVEDFQRMYTRTMDGFKVMEDFLLFIGETYRDCFWVVSCKQYAWQFLDLAINISRNFPLVLKLTAVSRKDSEQVIMQRHRFSGYSVEFNLPERYIESRKYRNLADEKAKREYRRNVYFDMLHETAAGNIAVMIKLWVQSIAEHDGQNLTIEMIEDREIALIDLLREDDYFVLAVILQHGSTGIEKLSKILKISQDKARLTLNYLTNKGVLEKIDGEFKVRLMLYRQIVRLLQRRNIIQ